MHILVEALATTSGGGRTFVQGLVPAMASTAPEDRFFVLLPRSETHRFNNLPDNVLLTGIDDRIVRYPKRWLLFEIGIPRFCRQQDVNAALFLGNILPFRRIQRSLRSILVLHQMLFLEHGDFGWPILFRGRLALARFLSKRSARRADHLITISETARSLLLAGWQLRAEQVTAIYHGVRHDLYHPSSDPSRSDALLERFHIARPFILSAGGMYPYKDHGTTVEALARLVRDPAYHDLHLVIVTNEGLPPYRRFVDQLVQHHGLGDKVRILSHFDADDLATLYRAAEVFVTASQCEVFGLTPIEAMASGCPVVAARASAIPEICGDAAWFFDPGDPEDLASRITEVLETAPERPYKRGMDHAAHFTWERSAKAYLDLLKQEME